MQTDYQDFVCSVAYLHEDVTICGYVILLLKGLIAVFRIISHNYPSVNADGHTARHSFLNIDARDPIGHHMYD